MSDTAMGATSPTTAADRELVIERVFNAPRELVFQAFSSPEHLVHWWGPKGWTLPVCEQDFRPGGTWLYCMRGPNGEDGWGKGIYHEIVPPEKIVYTDYFVDAEGNPLPGMPEMVNTLTFIEVDGKTRFISLTVFATAAEREATLAMGAIEGFNQTLDRLEAYLTQL